MKAALFDMDGTLINVLDLWRGLLSCYLAPFGASLSEEQFSEAMTLPYDHLAVYLQKTCDLPKTPQEIMDEIDELSIIELAEEENENVETNEETAEETEEELKLPFEEAE